MRKTAILLIIFIIVCCLFKNLEITPPKECWYEYTDLDNNTGKMYFCYSTFGSMQCQTGDRKYTIQVKEYHRVCEEVK